MPISNKCFLDWSKNLLDSVELSETDSRAIVSRSYYSAYHEALRLADDFLKIGVRNMSGGSHIKLSDALCNYICSDKETQKTIRRLGARVNAMHAMRVRSDYLFDENVTPSDASAQVRNVSNVLSIIELEISKTEPANQ